MGNEFKDLVPAAKSELSRILRNSENEKLVVEVSKMILEGAGELKPAQVGAQILIKDSQVQLLVATAKEIGDGRGKA